MSPTDDSLFYLAGATEGTTQWRADSLQFVNWGGFQTPHTVHFAPGTTLLSGASGTGKSTLLDAYLAVMMDSATPFNGASNDATIGRARGADQRNLVSYLRGKMDTTRDPDTGLLKDRVLRGQKSDTWGALAVTFIDDHGRLYTAARLFYVPQSATRDSDLLRKMCTVEGTIDLRDLAPLVESRFDRRALEGRFPNLKVHDSYGAFSQAFFTRLGIGAHGDGGKAMRLLARIQAGHQVRTVDDLYKSMVIELPDTYAAADEAVEHFKDLEDAYQAMLTEGKKLDVLNGIVDLNGRREAALEEADRIDTFGIHRTGDTSFELWKRVTLNALLSSAEDLNRELRAQSEKERTRLEASAAALISRKVDIEADLSRNETHTTVARLEADITELGFAYESARENRSLFDEQTARLDIDIDSEAEFVEAQAHSRTFIEGFEAARKNVTDRMGRLRDDAYEPSREKSELGRERESLSDRDGRMDPRLHQCRLLIAQATGIDPNDLPFVGELIDVLPEQKHWRKAIETTLFGVARIMLINSDDLDRVSHVIDPLHLPHRINFEGVELAPYNQRDLDPAYVSGKVAYKVSPFSPWVQDRISATSTDALCVDSPDSLRGGGRRVTGNGQTRLGRSGAHGESNARDVIGFSKEERLREIAHRVNQLDTILSGIDDQRKLAQSEDTSLQATKASHDKLLSSTWKDIDHSGLSAKIIELTRHKDHLLQSDDALRELHEELNELTKELKEANGKTYLTTQRLNELKSIQEDLVARKDQTATEIERIDRDQTVTLTNEQAAYLNSEYAQVGSVGDLEGFEDGVGRLRKRLSDLSTDARDKSDLIERALESAFQRYLDMWKDPNLSARVENYPSFLRILDSIRATGLHERRQEWSRRLTDWSGQDLVPLAGAFSLAIEDIRNRLAPINAILFTLPFSDRRDRLQIDLRELHRDDIVKFKRELSVLSRANTVDFTDDQIQNWFKRLRRFMGLIRKDAPEKNNRDYFLDVRKHIEITAIAYDQDNRQRSTYAALGGKSGGETQELIAFIVGAALRFQLGDEAHERPRFAPVFLDEGFVKADSEFAGRSVDAWKGLGFQLIIGAPYGQFTALEPHADRVLYMAKNSLGHSSVVSLPRTVLTRTELMPPAGEGPNESSF